MGHVLEGEYLLTGGTGFVGSVLAETLVSRGVRVRALVRNPAKASSLKERGVSLVEGELRNPKSLAEAVKGVRGVFHVAAVYRETNIPDRDFFAINTEGTKLLLEASVAAGVPRFIHCSTGGVLGDIKEGRGSDQTPYAPDDVYQESKVEGEKIALEFFRSGKISGAVIRPGMVYGPGDTRFLKLFLAIAKRRFFHVGSGRQWVHYVDVRDLVDSFILAMQHSEVNGQIYCIAGREPLSFLEFVDIVAQELRVKVSRLHIPLKPLQMAGSICEAICKPFGISPPLYRRRVDFFAKNRIFDISRAQAELGYAPRQDVRGEVRDVVQWYRSHGLLGKL